MKQLEKYSNKTITCYFDNTEGYYFESNKTGNNYALLEGMSYKGKTTSDITFLMIASHDAGYTGLLNYFFGATNLDSTLTACLEEITEYENGDLKPLDEF